MVKVTILFSLTDEVIVGEHFAFVYRQIVGLIQYSENWAFLDKE